MRKHIQVYLKIKFVYCVQNISRRRPRITLNMSNKLQMRSRKDLETERIHSQKISNYYELAYRLREIPYSSKIFSTECDNKLNVLSFDEFMLLPQIS